MKGRYDVLPYGIEDLEGRSGIQQGSVDCILTLQCLYSIPEPEKNIGLLYGYLKPGGRWYVYEHVRAEEGISMPLYHRKLRLSLEEKQENNRKQESSILYRLSL